MKDLQRHYDKLTDLERFRAVMAAFERDDEGEVRALRSTAPKATYRMIAWPYRGMLDGIRKVAWVMVTVVLASWVTMFMAWGVDRARRAKERYEADVDDGDIEDIEEEADIEDYEPTPWGIAVEAAESVLVGWAGLALFCDDLGITVEQALARVLTPQVLTIALDFARDFLEMEEKLVVLLAQEICETEGELEKLLAEREANLAERREEEAKKIADALKQIWETDVNG